MKIFSPVLMALALFASITIVSKAMPEQDPAAQPKPSVFFPTGSDWVNYDESYPKTHYPIIIQGGVLVGDGATYRAIFAEIPSKGFQHVALHGLRTEQYEKKGKELSDLGYALIYHQQFMAMGGLTHQAVWVKLTAVTNRIEQDANQPATAPKSKIESNESDDTLNHYLSKSDSVASGTIVSEPIGVTDELGVVEYHCDFRVSEIFKGDAIAKGFTTRVAIARFEQAATDRHPLLKKGSDCILFLKTSSPTVPILRTADFWFGIQPSSTSLAQSLKRLVQKP